MAVKESYAGKINRKLTKKLRVIAVAAGREKADLVLKNATYVNVFSNELCHGDIAVAEGLIVGMGEYSGNTEVDMGGKIVLPGFVDAHIHLESSLVSPTEFAKAVLPHGTTTVITDPHEIANVMGTDGIEYMLQATEDLPVDVRFMLPSCVPATPLDESGANLDYRAIDSFYDHPRVQGLAEMMNFVGTINGDPQVVEKIVASQAHHKKIDGHAPDLVGNDLNARAPQPAIWKRWSPCCATSMLNAVCSAPMTSTPTTCWKRVTSTTSSKRPSPWAPTPLPPSRPPATTLPATSC